MTGIATAASAIGRKAANASGLDTSATTWASKALTWTSNAASSLFGGLWQWKLPLLALALFIAGVGVLRGCSPFDIGKSKDTLRAERDAAESEVRVKDIVIERNENISAIAIEVAALRAQISVLSSRGRDAIAAATPENEAPLDAELVRALRLALDELCVVRANGSRADSCGPDA